MMYRWLTYAPGRKRLALLLMVLATMMFVTAGCAALGSRRYPAQPPSLVDVDVISSTTRARDGMVMVYVPAGTFIMGADLAPDNQSPAHEVALDAFRLDQTEVTNAQYDLCVGAAVCAEDAYPKDRTLNGDAQPVVGVSWHDALAYCTWVGGRLPTEAEWEYAARGPEGPIYPWGDEPQVGLANCHEGDCADGFKETAPVGSFPGGASWVGAVDMAGNVWEWVSDWYFGGYYGWSPRENPTGPESGQTKVVRGGSWEYNWANIRSRKRSSASPGFRDEHLGFRCVVDVDAE